MSTLKAFYDDTAIENWTCTHIIEYYRSNLEQKDRKKVLDRIKKDLEEVEDSDSFDTRKKRKAREILDNWKNWTGAQRNIKRSSEVNIGRIQVKKMKNFASGSSTQIVESSNITFGRHQETTSTEGTSSREGDSPSSTGRGNDEIEQERMSEEDFKKFTEAFQQLDDEKKWVLTSGKVVEDELYKFGMRCNYEHLCHSFIIDPYDKSFIEENVFTPSEIREIHTHGSKQLPNIPHDLLEYLSSYKLSTISDLRTRVFKPEQWQSVYNRQKDFDRDWIRNTVDNLIREYEADSLKKGDHLEGWLLSHVWLFIDKAFENLEGVEAIRGESCSIASSSRKNRDRKVPSVRSMPRKIMGRRGDLIIRCMYREYGCGEAGKLYTGYNGTKILRERGLKTPKMMKDQFDDLCMHMGSKEKKIRKLETIGFIHAGLSVLLLRLDAPAGYVSRISRSKMLTIPSNISEFGKGVLPAITLAWKAKKIVSNVIEMMNENDEENPLQALQESCEDTSLLSPPRNVIRRTTNFDTPSSKDKKGTSSNKITSNEAKRS